MKEFIYPQEIVIKLTQYSKSYCRTEKHSWKTAINGFSAKCRLCGKELNGLKEISKYSYEI